MPNFFRWPDLSDISEWIKIEGQGIKGTHVPPNFLEGHRFACAPDLRETFKYKNIMHYNYK